MNEPNGIERFYAHVDRMAAARTTEGRLRVWRDWAAGCERRECRLRDHQVWIEKNLAKYHHNRRHRP